MKQGKTLAELAAALDENRRRAKDYVVDARQIRVLTGEGGTEVVLPGLPEFAPADLFHRQLGTALGVRADLYDRLRRDHPPVFDGLVNGLLDRSPIDNGGKALRRMVRTYSDGGPGGQGIARCVLSDRYRRVDDYDLAEAVLPIIAEIDSARVEVCELTERRMYIKVVAPNLSCNLDDLITPGVHEFYREDDPDTVFAGFVISNSEVGAGALSVDHMLYRVRCRNGLIAEKALRRTHLGARVEADEDLSVYRDETLLADDRALLMKVQDAVRNAVDETRFRALALQFAETKVTAPMEQPIESMKALSQKVGLSDGEGQSVLQHLLLGGDLSQFGAVNAITRAAHDVESYDRSVELEYIGADVMKLSATEWGRIAAAA